MQPHAPRFIPVVWEPPANWIKVNTDGSFHNSSRAGYGGIFRGIQASFVGAFSCKATVHNAMEAEVLAVIEAIRVAWLKCWMHLWLETDSSLMVHYFNSPRLVPCRLKISWMNCLSLSR